MKEKQERDTVRGVSFCLQSFEPLQKHRPRRTKTTLLFPVCLAPKIPNKYFYLFNEFKAKPKAHAVHPAHESLWQSGLGIPTRIIQ